MDLNWLTLLSGVVIPMLVALVTAQLASPAVKSVVLAALAAVAGVVTELVSVDGVFASMDWSASASNAVAVFLVAVGAHFGLLKPTGLTGSSGAIQSSVAGGVGDQRSTTR